MKNNLFKRTFVSKSIFILLVAHFGFSLCNENNIVYSSLILQPKIKLNSTNSRLSSLTLSALSGLGTGYGSFKALKWFEKQYQDHNFLNDENNNRLVYLSLICGTTGSLLSWFLTRDHYSNSYKTIAAERFIKYWPEYKKNTPKELHQICDHYYELYKKNQYDFRDQAIAFVNLIEKFHQKDEKNIFLKIKSFFDRKFFTTSLHADLGSTLNGVSNVIKSVKNR